MCYPKKRHRLNPGLDAALWTMGSGLWTVDSSFNMFCIEKFEGAVVGVRECGR